MPEILESEILMSEFRSGRKHPEREAINAYFCLAVRVLHEECFDSLHSFAHGLCSVVNVP